jgi:hypothetical protein
MIDQVTSEKVEFSWKQPFPAHSRTLTMTSHPDDAKTYAYKAHERAAEASLLQNDGELSESEYLCGAEQTDGTDWLTLQEKQEQVLEMLTQARLEGERRLKSKDARGGAPEAKEVERKAVITPQTRPTSTHRQSRSSTRRNAPVTRAHATSPRHKAFPDSSEWLNLGDRWKRRYNVLRQAKLHAATNDARGSVHTVRRTDSVYVVHSSAYRGRLEGRARIRTGTAYKVHGRW